MSSDLDPIVTVNISRDTATVTREGFGTVLILSNFADIYDPGELWRYYTNTADMVTDGFNADTLNEHAVRAAANVFAQADRPARVAVACLPSAAGFTQTLTITSSTAGDIVKVTVLHPDTGAETDIAYTILADATTTTVATAVELLIEAVSGVNSSSSGANIAVVSASGTKKVHLKNLQNCTVEEGTTDAGYDDLLDDLLADEDLEFFHIVADSTSNANVTAIAGWAETNQKMYWSGRFSSGTLAGTNSVNETLRTDLKDYTVIGYVGDSWKAEDASWAGYAAGKDPGTYTMRKSIKNTTPVKASSTQQAAMKADNINFVKKYRNRTLLQEGKTIGGEWIDVVIGCKALEARLQEDVFDAITTPDRFAYSRKGLDGIKNVLLAGLHAFAGTEDRPGLLLDDTITVTLPVWDDISDADKQAREVNGITFDAELQQAAHYVRITGTVHN